MNDRIEIKAAFTVTDEGKITGVAWPFGSADRVGDVIEKGAITSPKNLPMLFSHDQAQVIGVWDQITETDAGLTVKGRLLVDDVERAREVRAMIRNKAVSGLSIGFVTQKSTPNRKGRTINALTLHEISVVAIPCHPGAQITSLKSDDTPIKENHMEPEEIEIEPNAQTPANDAPQIDTKPPTPNRLHGQTSMQTCSKWPPDGWAGHQKQHGKQPCRIAGLKETSPDLESYINEHLKWLKYDDSMEWR